MVSIHELLKTRILLLDGAMGTQLHNFELTEEDFGGAEYEGCNEYLSITRPDIIKQIYLNYLNAGADIIETNSFAGSSITLAEFGLEDKDYEINVAAAKIGREAVDSVSTPDHPRLLAGAIGPTNKSIVVTGSITFDELEESYYRQAKALQEGGVDVFLVETVFDTLNAKAALSALDRLKGDTGVDVPIILSITIEQNGTMLAGQDIEAAYAAMSHLNLASIGMNCATGPDLMKDHLRTLAQIAHVPVHCYPNAGLPQEDGTFPLTPQLFSEQLSEFVQNGWVNLIGGCCGTTPEHISALRSIIDHEKRRTLPQDRWCAVSGTEALLPDDDNRPIIVGERTNVIGSRKFKKLICQEEFELASEIGRAQVKKGAQVVDVCLANPDRDENEDTVKFYNHITKKVRAPLMVDSTDHKVIETALKMTQGKCIINSINFEDGLERIEEIMPLVKKYGAAVVFGTIDEDKEQAMATTVERKVAIAKRAYKYLTEEWGMQPGDIIYDPLVFPIATGDEKYADSGDLTIKGIKAVKEACPGTKTILGVSNVSFGLPPAGREVLNSVFLYHATNAGLDYAIVNSEKLMRFASISDDEKKLADDLIFQRVDDPITPFVEFYRGKKVVTEKMEELPLNERLARYILEGRKDGLVEDLEEARVQMQPLEIINGPLMDGMDEVGRLFNANELIVSEVLQSAESMKAAVGHLEQYMDKNAGTAKGKVIIATVKGDVHDIGKNLFAILLKNNCFDVVDLGIKVPPERLKEAYEEHKPDVVGLSGLLVKSAQMMVTTAEDLKASGISVPMLVGGAALSERFTAKKIQPAYDNCVAYAKSAMVGLSMVREIVDGKEAFAQKTQERFTQLLAEGCDDRKDHKGCDDTTRSTVLGAAEPIAAPTLEPTIVDDVSIQDIFEYINPQALYCTHFGLKGIYSTLLENKDPRLLKLIDQVAEMKQFIVENSLLKPRALYQFFECNAQGNNIVVTKNDSTHETFTFRRQEGEDKLCVSDFIAERSDGVDTMGFFVTTCGEGVIEKATELREAGEYLKSHMLQVIALESAEAFAELIHERIRKEWGIEDAPLSKTDIFRTKYRGMRLSFGYPACPNMDDQQKLFKLLNPSKIGVQLSENMMMDPEASVSAMVFHHKKGKYFSL